MVRDGFGLARASTGMILGGFRDGLKVGWCWGDLGMVLGWFLVGFGMVFGMILEWFGMVLG